VTTLYRHFDKAGTLLYVGISTSAAARLVGHKHGSGWFDDLATITIEHYDSREEALEAEKKAIINEKPLYNRDHNKRSIIGKSIIGDLFIFKGTGKYMLAVVAFSEEEAYNSLRELIISEEPLELLDYLDGMVESLDDYESGSLVIHLLSYRLPEKLEEALKALMLQVDLANEIVQNDKHLLKITRPYRFKTRWRSVYAIEKVTTRPAPKYSRCVPFKYFIG